MHTYIVCSHCQLLLCMPTWSTLAWLQVPQLALVSMHVHIIAHCPPANKMNICM